jgi:hypothetical protein
MEEILASSTEVAEGVDTSIALVNFIKAKSRGRFRFFLVSTTGTLHPGSKLNYCTILCVCRLPPGSKISHLVWGCEYSSREPDPEGGIRRDYEHAIPNGKL